MRFFLYGFGMLQSLLLLWSPIRFMHAAGLFLFALGLYFVLEEVVYYIRKQQNIREFKKLRDRARP